MFTVARSALTDQERKSDAPETDGLEGKSRELRIVVADFNRTHIARIAD